MKVIQGYHFTSDTLRDGQPIPKVGEWLVHDGDVIPCKLGLHASEHPFDALTWAPGNLLHKVELRGDLQSQGDPVDKWVGRERRIIASADAEKMLRKFACDCALSVVHLWNPPQIVLDYLKTQDESKRAAAWDAAWAAEWDAARDAAWDAAWDDAAWAAAREAAWDAACAAAWDDAARNAVRDAAWDAQRKLFTSMVDELFTNESN